MQHDIRKYLWDASDALAEIASYAETQTSKEFHSNRMMQLAVERLVIIVAKALRRTEYKEPQTAERIHSLRQVSNFRNLLVHEYDKIAEDVVWKIVKESAPILKSEIDAWLVELDKQAE
jgi:uncharacterized protein with HEPN domain